MTLWTQRRAGNIGETIIDKARHALRRMVRPAPKKMGRRVIQPDAPWGSWSAGYNPPTMPLPREEYDALVRLTEAEKKNARRW